MVSRPIARSTGLLLAAWTALLVASVAAPTLAADTTTSADAAHAKPAKKAPAKKDERAAKASKKATSAHAKKSAKAAAKQPAAAKKPAAKVPPAAAKDAAVPSLSKARTVAKRAPAGKKTAKKASARPSRAAPCSTPAVTIERGGLEIESFPLVTCAGAPLDEARARLSILARPFGVARPEPVAAGKAPAAQGETVAPGIRRIDPGLVTRLFLIAHQFPGKALTIVSGYRPSSRGSLHQSARAVDLRVDGVGDADLVAFCKTIPDTGCGFYPNSSFVHVDVRTPGTGSVSWIDASGPGESPSYVTQWPPADDAPGVTVKAPRGADGSDDEALPAPPPREGSGRPDHAPSPPQAANGAR